MKRVTAILLFAGMVFLGSASTGLADDYEDGQANPFRMLAYLVNPVGVALEWIIARPLHALADANSATRYIFGHTPHADIFAEDPVDAIRRERAKNLQRLKAQEERERMRRQP